MSVEACFYACTVGSEKRFLGACPMLGLCSCSRVAHCREDTWNICSAFYKELSVDWNLVLQ